MKTLLLCICILLCMSNTWGQSITITGLGKTNQGYDREYVPISTTALYESHICSTGPSNVPSTYVPPINDANTTVYANCTYLLFIVRVNGIWSLYYQGDSDNGATRRLHIYHPSSSLTPPCGAVWIDDSDNTQYHSTIAGACSSCTQPSSPTITATATTVCQTNPATTLTMTSCGGIPLWNTGATTASITVSPTVSTTYSAYCIENNCSAKEPVRQPIVIVPKPVVNYSSSINLDCNRRSTTLTSSCPVGTLQWNTGATTSSITVSPTQTTTYTAACTSNGCVSSGSLVVPFNGSFTITSSVSTANCLNKDVVLMASNCPGIITWSTGDTYSTIGVTVSQTTTYTATCSCQDGPNTFYARTPVSKTIVYEPIPIIRASVNNTTANLNKLKLWDVRYGGTNSDGLGQAIPTADGGYLLAGSSGSPMGGDKSEDGGQLIYVPYYPYSALSANYWVVKLDANGKKVWDKSFGSDGHANLKAVVATPDGGYLLGGFTAGGIAGSQTQANNGLNDFWVIKITSTGTKVWDKVFGGNKDDMLTSLIATTDGGYLLGGTSASDAGGDKLEANLGNKDYWVVKIDGDGNKVWDKTLGTANEDELTKVSNTPDGGYLLIGYYNFYGYSTYEYGSRAIKIDGTGTPVWNHTYAQNYRGSIVFPNSGMLSTILPLSGGGYLLGGRKTVQQIGAENVNDDYWLMTINEAGDSLSSKTVGSYGDENLRTITRLSDGNLLLGGTGSANATYNPTGDRSETTSTTNGDIWLIKLDNNLNKLWDKRYGGTEFFSTVGLASIIGLPNSDFTIFGSPSFGQQGDKSQATRGNDDYWALKVKDHVDALTTPLSITAGQAIQLMATGCPAPVTWSNGATGQVLTVSPTQTTSYTATCDGQCSGTPFQVIVTGGNCPPNTSISAQSGNWAAETSWGCGGIPTASSVVQIKPGHLVTISTMVQVKKVQVESGGKLQYSAAGRLSITQ